MKKTFIEIISYRFKKLIDTLFKPSFLTWIAITFIYWCNKQQIDMNFLIFTASLVGMQKFFKRGHDEKNS